VISEDKIKAHRNFANKIWNASRFVMMNLDAEFSFVEPAEKDLAEMDKNILNKLDEVTKNVTKFLDSFDFHLAAEEIYQFFWHEYCDQYLEAVKPRLAEGSADKKIAQMVLYKVLSQSLKLLHPFMPYISEAVYQMLPNKQKEYIMIDKWPEVK